MTAQTGAMSKELAQKHATAWQFYLLDAQQRSRSSSDSSWSGLVAQGLRGVFREQQQGVVLWFQTALVGDGRRPGDLWSADAR